MDRLDIHTPDAIRYFGGDWGPGGSPSRYSDRRRPAAETVASMRGRLHEFGVTRLARVTGLDCVGIPVWTAIRPNAKTVSQSQGKGVDDHAAQASALMEAIEVATAEKADVEATRSTRRALKALGFQVNVFNEFLREGAEEIGSDEITKWVEGFDIISGRPTKVPLELVSLSDAVERPRYWQTTDGLASGNSLWEAVLHGLCERVERDAIALWRLRTDEDVERRCVAIESFGDPALTDLAERIVNAGLQLRIFDATCDSGVPVFAAFISRPADGSEGNWAHIDLSAGYGCHPLAFRAAIRAVTEAAQTRLTTVSGARDFYSPEIYQKKIDPSLLVYARARPRVLTPSTRSANSDPGAFVPEIVRQLIAIGVRSVVVVPIERGAKGFAVAKILVGDLESPAGPRKIQFGPRAHEFARRRQ